jgi:hypothetical protein
MIFLSAIVMAIDEVCNNTGCAINIFTIKKINISSFCENYRADFFIDDRGVLRVFIHHKIINGYDFKLLISILIFFEAFLMFREKRFRVFYTYSFDSNVT